MDIFDHLPLLILLSSLLPGLAIFLVREESHVLRTSLNLFGALTKLGLVGLLIWGVFHEKVKEMRWEIAPGLELEGAHTHGYQGCIHRGGQRRVHPPLKHLEYAGLGVLSDGLARFQEGGQHLAKGHGQDFLLLLLRFLPLDLRLLKLTSFRFGFLGLKLGERYASVCHSITR